MKTLYIGLVVVALIAIGAYFYPKSAALFGDATNFDAIGTEELKVGDGCNDFPSYSSCQGLSIGVNGTLTQGGGVTATTTAASGTLAASDFDTENLIEVSLTGALAPTITFPASTTFPLGTKSGSWRNFAVFNSSTTAGAIITIAGNTGTLLEVASSTTATGLKTIAPSGIAIFTAIRKANSDIELFMNPGQ